MLACKGGPRPVSNFDYAGPLTEIVLLGVLALQGTGQEAGVGQREPEGQKRPGAERTTCIPNTAKGGRCECPNCVLLEFLSRYDSGMEDEVLVSGEGRNNNRLWLSFLPPIPQSRPARIWGMAIPAD